MMSFLSALSWLPTKKQIDSSTATWGNHSLISNNDSYLIVLYVAMSFGSINMFVSMKAYNRKVLEDFCKQLDDMESIINLINADENEENIKDDLQSVVDHITFAHDALRATLGRT